jgi:hypothetical protein
VAVLNVGLLGVVMELVATAGAAAIRLQQERVQVRPNPGDHVLASLASGYLGTFTVLRLARLTPPLDAAGVPIAGAEQV